MNSFIQIKQVSKNFTKKVVFSDLNLMLDKGEIVALVGPSGTGKSTLLRCLAGLETFAEGDFLIDDKDMNDIPPHKRSIGMVFQQPLLFPNMNVLQNVMYGLRLKEGKKEAKEKAQQYLNKVGLSEYEKAFPDELSGGQQQRVALIRSLILNPSLLLLDEPFSSLDPLLRNELRDWIKLHLKEEGVTALFVTHDKEEAMMIGDRVALLNNGGIEQFSTPHELYYSPLTPFAASFFGSAIVLNDLAYILIRDLKIDRAHTYDFTKNEVYYLEGKVMASSYSNGHPLLRIHLSSISQTVQLSVSTESEWEPGQLLTLFVEKRKIRSFKK